LILERLARFCYRRRRYVLVVWLIALIGVTVLSKTAGGKDATKFSLPGTESQKAFDLLQTKFPARSGDTADIVFSATGPAGVRDPGVRQQMEAAFTAVKSASPHISDVTSPYTTQGAKQIAASGKVAYAVIQFDVQSNNLPKGASDDIRSAVTRAAHPGQNLEIEFSGQIFTTRTPPGGTEIVGVVAAIIILLLAFGSLLAMAMPIFIALFGIFIGLGLIAVLANFMDVLGFTSLIAAMIGIGVGIDYALFIVTRYRQGLHDGMSPIDATATAITTAGRAVIFAGCTVVIALMGMFIMGLSFINSLAVGAALAVLVTMIGSVTLLPAMLGFCGPNIDKFSLPSLHRSAGTEETRRGFWFRWSRQIQAHPWPFALGALALLLVLAFPVTHLRLGNPDAGNDPKGTTTRAAYGLLSTGFGPGYNGPLIVAGNLPRASDLTVMNRLDAALKADPGVASVGPVVPNNKANPTAAIINVIPKTAPQDPKTATLVRHLRSDVIAPTVANTDVSVHAGGSAAIGIDLTKKLSGRLAWFFGAVIALSFLLLMCVFRSVLVPLKAALMNLFSIAGSFGVLVAVFQWGWGGTIIGVSKQPIVAFSPMILFAIVFGLSMDYEVFLLSRVKEEHDRTGDNGLAVADGLAATARVITAAAAIMICVFLTFVFQSDATAKLIGLGLASAILIDATVVRMVLVPATMELLGEANWWLPKWLGRIIPNLSVEGSALPTMTTGAVDAEEPETVLAGR
jgi:RND superfamily putative drug exporter